MSRPRLAMRHYLPLWLVGMAVTILTVIYFIHPKSVVHTPSMEASILVAFTNLLELQSEQVARLDIARLNLLCAEGLPGAGSLDVNHALNQLDEMATRVRSETERHRYRFQRNPSEFEHSEGFFRMLMLTVVLAEDFGVHYDPERQNGSLAATEGDGFFADSSKVFLHGLLGSKRQGTCSSMPVLYVAVGRRLGYPLKLVTTKGHLFVRWEGAGERLNV